MTNDRDGSAGPLHLRVPLAIFGGATLVAVTLGLISFAFYRTETDILGEGNPYLPPDAPILGRGFVESSFGVVWLSTLVAFGAILYVGYVATERSTPALFVAARWIRFALWQLAGGILVLVAMAPFQALWPNAIFFVPALLAIVALTSVLGAASLIGACGKPVPRLKLVALGAIVATVCAFVGAGNALMSESGAPFADGPARSVLEACATVAYVVGVPILYVIGYAALRLLWSGHADADAPVSVSCNAME
ncbi:MAG: hypothetical protein JNM94_00315 [Phycisphaerae bacterium]|nr:hypothetical protein [Phycisphaerae bacterium]